MKCNKCKNKMKIEKARPILDGGVFTYVCEKCNSKQEITKSENKMTKEEIEKVLQI